MNECVFVSLCTSSTHFDVNNVMGNFLYFNNIKVRKIVLGIKKTLKIVDTVAKTHFRENLDCSALNVPIFYVFCYG